MTYYKIIIDGNIVGVANTENLRKYQAKHHVLLYSDENDMEYIDVNGILYRDNWLKPTITNIFTFTEARIIAISEEEYIALLSALETEDEIQDNGNNIDDNLELIPDNNEVNEDDVITLEYIKNTKIAEMSRICNQVITNGVDVVLSDGESHHFSLTVQDQLNLISLSSMVQSGALEIPYHADGELCKYYNADEISWIVNAATQLKAYHTTYFNSLKAYIESLDNIQTISAIQYGCTIPEAFKSDILKEYEAMMNPNNNSQENNVNDGE